MRPRPEPVGGTIGILAVMTMIGSLALMRAFPAFETAGVPALWAGALVALGVAAVNIFRNLANPNRPLAAPAAGRNRRVGSPAALPLVLGAFLFFLGLGVPMFEALQFRWSQAPSRPAVERPEPGQRPPDPPVPIPWKDIIGDWWKISLCGAALLTVSIALHLTGLLDVRGSEAPKGRRPRWLGR